MKCMNCGGAMKESVENYHYTESGLPHITLTNIPVRRCAKCGNVEAAIANVGGMHKTLALGLVAKKGRLVGAEIRFLRKHLGYSSTDFARAMGVRKETVSRWESGDQDISKQADLVLRYRVVTGKQIEAYADDAKDEPVRLAIHESGHKWVVAAA